MTDEAIKLMIGSHELFQMDAVVIWTERKKKKKLVFDAVALYSHPKSLANVECSLFVAQTFY